VLSRVVKTFYFFSEVQEVVNFLKSLKEASHAQATASVVGSQNVPIKNHMVLQEDEHQATNNALISLRYILKAP